MKRENVRATAGLVAVCVLFGATVCIYRSMEIKDGDEYVFEYGENPVDLLKEKLKADKVSIEGIEGGSLKPDVGEYDAVVERGKSTHNLKVKIEDTVKPEFIESVDTVVLPVGEGSEADVTSKFRAADASDVLEYYIDGEVKFDEVGEYYVKVACSDMSSNTSETNVAVYVE